jgi:hypothetical protein
MPELVARKGRTAEVRSEMSDDDGTADEGLIDVSKFSLSELRDEVDGSSLAAALERIFARQDEGVNYSFVSNI